MNSVKNSDAGSAVDQLLGTKRDKILRIWNKEYRYAAHCGQWQVRPSGTYWWGIDDLNKPFVTTEEIQSLLGITEIREEVSQEVGEVLDKAEQLKELQWKIDSLWENIVMARQRVESSRDGTGHSLSPVEQRNMEETIEKMLDERKQLIAKRNSITNESQNTPEEIVTEPTPEPTPEPVPEPNPTPEPVPELPDTSKIPRAHTIRANISDVQANLLDIARSRAEERLRREQKDSGFFGRAKLFFSRSKKLEMYIQEELAQLQTGGIFDASTQYIRENASDRFQKTNTLFGSRDIQARHSFTDPVINNISVRFIQGEISREEFCILFENRLNQDGVREQIADIAQQGTNILKYLDNTKALHGFLASFPDNATEAHQYIARFIANPVLRESLEDAFGFARNSSIEAMLPLLCHKEARDIVLHHQISVELSVLVWGNAAYEIKNSDRTDTRAYAVGKWLQKHPVLSSIVTGLGITTSSIVAGPIGNFVVGTLGIGTITGLRRGTEYTDEHSGFEKRITQGTHLQSEIYEKVAALRQELESASGIRKFILERRLRSAESKLELYQRQGVVQSQVGEVRKGTTHRHFAPIGALNRKLWAYINEKEGFETQGEESSERKKYFVQWTLQGLARLDAWKKTGHNFLKSRGEKDMEKDYNTLYENILLASRKLDISLEELRSHEDYKKIFGGLLADYERADASFDTARTNTSLKRGVTHGAIYGASSVVFQWLAGTGFFGSATTTTTSIITTPGGYQVDPAIADDLKNMLGPIKYQQFVDHLSHSTTPETLWDTLTKDIFQNTSVGNSVKNHIMTFILNATDIQNGITKPELLIEAAKHGLFSDIASHSTRIDRIIGLLHHWWYGSVDKTWLIQTLQWLNDGSVSITSLNSMEQTKVAEALWCYVHRDGMGAGSSMWQVFMDKLPDITTTTEIPTKNPLEWLGYLAIPTWRNTFLSPKKTADVINDDFVILDDTGKPIIFDDKKWEKSGDYFQDKTNKKEKEDWEKEQAESPTPEKTRHITRGDFIDGFDWEDVNPKYPNTPKKLLSLQEVTGEVIGKGTFFAKDYEIFRLYKLGKIDRDTLAKSIQETNEIHQKMILKNMEMYEKVARHAYEAVHNIFKKHNFPKERIMPYGQFRSLVRFQTFYEFLADSSDASPELTAGYNTLTSGLITINMNTVIRLPLHEQVARLKHILIHELLHGTSVENFWELSRNDGKLVYPRRSGLFLMNKKGRERGREMNEAIVEHLSKKEMIEIFWEDYLRFDLRAYEEEQRFVKDLSEKYDIPMSTFYQAAYNRKGIKDLAKALEGHGRKRKGFLAFIMSMMKYDLGDAQSLIHGWTVHIPPNKMTEIFHPSLLRNGTLSPDVREYVGIDQYGRISLI